ncbi:hypothetical protein [Sporosarcina phage Lietuvens]|nr:hypothetical protein [Sporosarcina phage Lietuvens]
MQDVIVPTIDGVPVQYVTAFKVDGAVVRINVATAGEIERMLAGQIVGYKSGHLPQFKLGEIESAKIGYIDVSPTRATDIQIVIRIKGGEEDGEETYG